MQHILSELTLIIPTKNDHKNIIDNFVKIQKYLTTKIKHYEILLISNGSNEASVRILDTFCNTNKNVSLSEQYKRMRNQLNSQQRDRIRRGNRDLSSLMKALIG